MSDFSKPVLSDNSILILGDLRISGVSHQLDLEDVHEVILSSSIEEAANVIPEFDGAPRCVFLSFRSECLESLPAVACVLLEAVVHKFPTSEVHLVSDFAVRDPDVYRVNDLLSSACYAKGCSFLDVNDTIENAHLHPDGFLTERGKERLGDCFLHAAVLSAETELIPWLSDASRENSVAAESEEEVVVAACWSKSESPKWSFQSSARLFVEVLIGGVPVNALIDSGATNSLLPSSMIPVLASKGIKVHFCDSELQLADGQSSSIEGKALIPLNVGGRTWCGEFYFQSSLPYSAILGVDCLRALNMSIDFSIPRVTLRGFGAPADVPLIHLCAASIDEDLSDHLTPTPSHPDITEEQYRQFASFLENWKAEFESSLALTSVTEHKIYVDPNIPPIKQKNYPMAPAIQEVVEAEVEKLLSLGHIEPSTSPWSSPLVVVNKSNGEKRVCVDFRALNKHTVKNSYPLPHLQSVLDSLKDSRIVSSIDLKSGFHQIPLEESSKPLTAFSVPGSGGLFQYRVMPFGLCNAPASFQHLMNVVLRPLIIQRKVYVYMDDLIVATRTYEEHHAVLDETFRLLRQAELSINWKKSTFLQPELEYLGHIVGQGHLRASPTKVAAVREFPAPRTVRQVRSFLGACAWFKRFIPAFSDLAEPLTRLLRKTERWSWGEEQKRSFEKLKECLASPPILSCPDFSKPFVVETDASNVGLGAVLRQEVDGKPVVIAYASRTLNVAERNLATTHKELLGVLFGIEKFRPYIEGTHFTLITDHSSLQWLQGVKNPTGKFARWILRLSAFDFKVVHRSGSQIPVSDCLSRAPYNLTNHTEDVEDDDSVRVAALTLTADFSKTTDPWYERLRSRIEGRPDAYPSFSLDQGRIFKRVDDRLLGKSLLLLVVPSDFRKRVMEECHDAPTAGHMGYAKTIARIRQDYYWANMSTDIRAFVAKCKTCQQFKAPNTRETGEMSAEPPSMKPMSVVSVDLIGPLPRSKKQNRFAVVVLDVASKYVIATAVRSATTAAVVNALKSDLLFTHGVPDVLMCDNGPAFISGQFKTFCSEYGIKLHHIPKYYARGNPVERSNRTLKTALSMYAHEDQRSWCEHLRHVTFAMNSSVSEVTSFTPHRLVFGRDLRAGVSLAHSVDDSTVGEFDAAKYDATLQYELALVFEKALRCVEKAKKRQADTYNLRHRSVSFSVGDLVWRRNFALSQGVDGIAAKLLPKFVGPFVIKDVLSPNQYQLSSLHNKDAGRWPATHLKLVI